MLYGYYKGIIASSKLEEACARNVVFMALSADTRPHFTTIAGFVAQMPNEMINAYAIPTKRYSARWCSSPARSSHA